MFKNKMKKKLISCLLSSTFPFIHGFFLLALMGTIYACWFQITVAAELKWSFHTVSPALLIVYLLLIGCGVLVILRGLLPCPAESTPTNGRRLESRSSENKKGTYTEQGTAPFTRCDADQVGLSSRKYPCYVLNSKSALTSCWNLCSTQNSGPSYSQSIADF